jgi:GNAT superfamily N-acetyltransferase
MMDTKHAGDTIVTIENGSIHRFLEHLLRLDEETRQQRFCHRASDADVRNYVGCLDLKRARIIGFFCDGKMRGAAELSPSGSARTPVFDATVSVEKDWQGRGIRTALVLRVISMARGLGASHIRVEGLAGNERLRRIVAQFEADMLFEDDDCMAWLPVGRMGHATGMVWTTPAVQGSVFPSG